MFLLRAIFGREKKVVVDNTQEENKETNDVLTESQEAQNQEDDDSDPLSATESNGDISKNKEVEPSNQGENNVHEKDDKRVNQDILDANNDPAKVFNKRQYNLNPTRFSYGHIEETALDEQDELLSTDGNFSPRGSRAGRKHKRWNKALPYQRGRPRWSNKSRGFRPSSHPNRVPQKTLTFNFY